MKIPTKNKIPINEKISSNHCEKTVQFIRPQQQQIEEKEYNDYQSTPTLEEKDDNVLDDDSSKSSTHHRHGHSKISLQEFSSAIIMIGVPIVITLLLVWLLVCISCRHDTQDCYKGQFFKLSTGFPSEESHLPMMTKAKNALITTTILISSIIVGTFMLVLVFYLNLIWCMNAYLLFALCFMMIQYSTILLKNFCYSFNLACDWLTIVFIVWNITGTGKYCMFMIYIFKFFCFVFLFSPPDNFEKLFQYFT